MKKFLFLGLGIVVLVACQNGLSQKDGIKTTTSGYRYQIAKDEKGELIKAGQFVLLHSSVSAEDSLLTDTRTNPGKPSMVKVDGDDVQRGASAPVQDLLKLLSVGDSARLYYPLDSFPTKPPRLEGYTEVVYDLKVLQVFQSEEDAKAYMNAESEKEQVVIKEVQAREQGVADKVAAFHAAYKNGEKDAEWKSTASGLKYIVLEPGSGPKPKLGELVSAHCYGIIADTGEHFYNSYKGGRALDFSVGAGEMIAAWDEGFLLLNQGDKAMMYVPSELGYAETGNPGAGIAPNTPLIFYVEFESINGK